MLNAPHDDNCVLKTINKSKATASVWGAFSIHGYTPLIRNNGTLNAERYTFLLRDNYLPFLNNLLPDGGQLLQDNAPIHTAARTIEIIINFNWNHIFIFFHFSHNSLRL